VCKCKEKYHLTRPNEWVKATAEVDLNKSSIHENRKNQGALEAPILIQDETVHILCGPFLLPPSASPEQDFMKKQCVNHKKKKNMNTEYYVREGTIKLM
jgi:hypothetical protein